LLAHESERRHGDPALLPARLTVDLYRLPDFSSVTVTTSIVRDGHRIKVIDAEFLSGDKSVGRATCQLLRRSANTPGNVWKPASWDVPRPHEIVVPEDVTSALGGMWAVRPIEGAFGTVGRKRVWMSEVRELVGGMPLTPWVRVALAADFASPFANSGDQGLGYINTDITLYLDRLPRTAWIGFDVVNHQAHEGVAIGECCLYDEDGPIGTSSVAALAATRRAPVPPPR
jgi:Thioesterase-like superfamily